MKKITFLIVIIFSLNAFSQEDAWVYFNDKPNFQSYYDNPLLMLSQRALDRRSNQNIALDTKDVPIFQSYVDQIDASVGITVMAKSKWLNCLHIRGTIDAINALTTFSFVDQVRFANTSLNIGGRTVSSNKLIKIEKVNKKLDTQITFNYGNSSNQIEMLNGNLLHQQNYTGTGKIIAVLDAGFPGVNILQPFQRLRDNNLILGGYNFVDRNEDIYNSNSHGTLVLSTMGGYVENQLVGTAPDASYYLFRTEDAATENPVEESLWVEAAETADSLGVDVINTSLGYFDYDNPSYSYTYEDMDGVTSFISRGADLAFSRGMVVVVSAGNSGTTANPHIGVPADALNALTVGAVNSIEQYAAFSSIGPSFDQRTKPDVMAQGQSAVVCNQNGNIVTASGTSFSGPITAGLVASLWQALPTKTNAEIIQFIKASADNFSTPNAQLGFGIPDFNLALNNALSLENFSPTDFILNPNPTNGILKINFPAKIKNANITFYNSIGQMVVQKSISKELFTLDLTNLSAGIYFYSIQSNTINQNGKIIKK
jgi:subtilisin family serine protease